jgi:hypothetical protein
LGKSGSEEGESGVICFLYSTNNVAKFLRIFVRGIERKYYVALPV